MEIGQKITNENKCDIKKGDFITKQALVRTYHRQVSENIRTMKATGRKTFEFTEYEVTGVRRSKKGLRVSVQNSIRGGGTIVDFEFNRKVAFLFGKRQEQLFV